MGSGQSRSNRIHGGAARRRPSACPTEATGRRAFDQIDPARPASCRRDSAGLADVLACACGSVCPCRSPMSSRSRPALSNATASIERWNGTAWSIAPGPKPRAPGGTFLRAVSCTSRSDCIAVGSISYGRGRRTFAERWNGFRWSIVVTPNPPGAVDSAFNSVSCYGRDRCIAVGSSQQSTGRIPLAERLAGRTWSIQPTPTLVDFSSPHPPRNDAFRSVSCTSNTACMAVGSTATGSTATGACSMLAERWNGTAWSVAPSLCRYFDVVEVDVYGVSCTSSTTCTTVGSTFIEEFGYVPLTARLNRGRWSIGKPSTQADNRESNFVDQYDRLGLHRVSCTTATTCMTVGANGLIEHISGATRSVQRGPRRSGIDFTDVSCANSCELRRGWRKCRFTRVRPPADKGPDWPRLAELYVQPRQAKHLRRTMASNVAFVPATEARPWHRDRPAADSPDDRNRGACARRDSRGA